MSGFDSNFFDYVLGRSGDVIGTLLQQAGAGHGLGQATDPFSNNGYFTNLADRITNNKYQQQRNEAQYQQKQPGQKPGQPGQQQQPPPGPQHPLGLSASGTFEGMQPGNGFIGSILPLAVAAESRTGVPAALSAAVAANETGLGMAPQGGQRWNSYHGIRGQGTAGQTPGGFRANNEPGESFDDFANLLTQDPTYRPAWNQYQNDQDVRLLLRNIAAAGYARNDIPDRDNPSLTEAQAWIPRVEALYERARAAQASAQSMQANAPNPAPQSPVGGIGGHMWHVAFGYGQRYTTPLPGGTTHHRGVDLVIPGATNNGRGQTYNAFVPGTVVALTHDSAGGNGIIVQSSDGLYQRYFHNDRVLVQQGQQVDQTTPLGVVGATGTEGFPHLHFEVSRRINGDPMGQTIDPQPWIQGATQ